MAKEDESLIPFENVEEFFEWSAKKLAEGILGGIADAIVGEIIDKLFGEEPTVKKLLDDAVRRFAEKVDVAINKEALRKAKNDFESLTVILREVNHYLEHAGPSWWLGPTGESQLDKIMAAEKHATDLMSNLGSLGLAGWQTYMLAGSLRLRIAVTLMQVPGPGAEETQRNIIADAIRQYTDHHWNMCGKVRALVWPNFSIEKASVYRHFRLKKIDPFYFFRVCTNLILPLLRAAGVDDQEWLAKMPPVADVGRSHDFAPMDKPALRPDEYWYFWKRGKGMDPKWASAIYCIPKKSKTFDSVKEIRATLRLRRSELEFWFWLQNNKGPIGSLHDIPIQWWTNQEPTRVRRAKIRAANGKYVVALVDKVDRGSLCMRRRPPRRWAVFEIIDMGANKIALRADNKQYVAAELYGEYRDQPLYYGELVANKNWTDRWETFRKVELGNRKVAFRAANKKYVSVVQLPRWPGTKLIANGNKVSYESTFKFVEV